MKEVLADPAPGQRRIPSLAKMQREIEAWVGDRDQRLTEINWHFKTKDARIKLKSLYPQL